jgi:hypothetical protein
MSLLLVDQKLGSHSQPGSSSHKFMLKGRQTGSMHRGHSWVFRAETYDTMLAWYDDIRALTEKTGEERNAFVRKHARSFSAGSHKASSISGDSALDEDEADDVPFSATDSVTKQDGSIEKPATTRPEPGGRFPSDLNINRHLQAPFSSDGSSMAEQDITTMAGGLQQTTDPKIVRRSEAPAPASYAFPIATTAATTADHEPTTSYESAAAYQQHNPASAIPDTTHVAATTAGPEPINSSPVPPPQASALPPSQDPFLGTEPSRLTRRSSDYASWMAPAAAGTQIGAAGALGAEEYWRGKRQEAEERQAAQEVDTADTPKTPVVAGQPPQAPVAASSTEQTPHTPITVSGRSDTAMSTLSQSTVPTELSVSPAVERTEHTLYDTNPDGSVNATPTGRIFPTVLRHNTDTSASNLHVPGEFPKAPAI